MFKKNFPYISLFIIGIILSSSFYVLATIPTITTSHSTYSVASISSPSSTFAHSTTHSNILSYPNTFTRTTTSTTPPVSTSSNPTDTTNITYSSGVLTTSASTLFPGIPFTPCPHPNVSATTSLTHSVTTTSAPCTLHSNLADTSHRKVLACSSILTPKYITSQERPTLSSSFVDPIVVNGFLLGALITSNEGDISTTEYKGVLYLPDNISYGNTLCNVFNDSTYIGSAKYDNLDTLSNNQFVLGSRIDPFPRPVLTLDPLNPDYLNLVQTVLTEQGLKDVSPVIQTLYYFDLDGSFDQEGPDNMEALIHASNIDPVLYSSSVFNDINPHFPILPYNTYSYLILVDSKDGQLTYTLLDQFTFKPNEPITTRLIVEGVLNLDDDFIFDLVTTKQDPNTLIQAFRITNDKLKPFLSHYICAQ